jgi:protocatechuate 3,4-dioxygenase beta subunit
LAAAAAGATAGSPGIWTLLTGKVGIYAGIAVFVVAVGLWKAGVFQRASKAGSGETAEIPAGMPNTLRAHRAAVSSRTALARQRAVKMAFQVISAETGASIANAAVHAAFFGPGGSGEGQDTFTVTGQVTDLAGLPIAHAEVRELNSLSYRRQKVSTDEGGSFVLGGVSGYESTTGRSPERTASGAYLIRGLLGTGKPSLKLVVQAEGFAPEIQTVALVAPTNRVHFELSEGCVFWGRVVDEEGQPVPNAVVQTDTGPTGFWTYLWFSHADPEGYFEWRSAPRESALYWFEAPGYETRRDVLLVADGSEHEIRLKRIARAK